jgi:puromycin-sensitive aminopeptidase
MYDVLTYEKGGSVLRMLEQYLGPETFRDGIRRYLKDHAYANTVTADLWDALEAVSGQPVASTMNTWILQGGHPVITVEDATISQAPFSFTPRTADSAIGLEWLVPVRSRPLHGTEVHRQLLGAEPQPLAAAAPAIANAGGTGVYRTSYGTSELAQIAQSLDALDELERSVLVNDTWALVLAGRRTISDLLALARGLGDEVEPATWSTLATALGFIYRAAEPADREAVSATVRALLQPRLAHLGWEPVPGESERTQTLRGTIIGTLGTFGEDHEVRAEALARFDTGVVEGDLAGAVLSAVGYANRPGDYDEVLDRYRSAKDPQSEQRYRRALTQFQDVSLAERTFDLCFTEFRLQDVPLVVLSLLANRTGGKAAWVKMADRWDDLMSKMPSKSASYLVTSVTTFIDDRAFAERVAAFHRAHPVESGQRSVDQDLERMLMGVAFAERVRPGLAAVFAT